MEVWGYGERGRAEQGLKKKLRALMCRGEKRDLHERREKRIVREEKEEGRYGKEVRRLRGKKEKFKSEETR